jgi:hypothetical protein
MAAAAAGTPGSQSVCLFVRLFQTNNVSALNNVERMM